MKSTARLVVCAVAALALAGVGASAQAVASPASGHHRRLEQDGSSRLLLALGRLDRRLVHATSAHRLAPLTDADRVALQNNAEADEAAVGAVATDYSADPSSPNAKAARDVLHGYHPARYVRATAILRHSEATAARIAALLPGVPADSADAADLATASSLLAGVTADSFSATTEKATMQAARSAVAQARALVGQVESDVSAG